MSEHIDSNLSIGGKAVAGVTAPQVDEESRLGFSAWHTTGDVVVPRDWLLEQVERYGLPEAIVPKQHFPSGAYKLAVGRLLNKTTEDAILEFEDGNKYVEFDIRKGQRNVRYLFAIIHEDESVTENGEGKAGNLEKPDLGHFNFDFDTQSPTWHVNEEIIGTPLLAKWNMFVQLLKEEFERMKVSYNGQDMRIMFYNLIESESTAIPIRHGGVVYFFPERYGSYLEGMSKIWKDINDFKEGGYTCNIVTMPVVDEDHLRELIERHATEELNKRTDEILTAAIKQLSDNEEATATEIASEVIKELRDVNTMASEYTQLLQVKLSVKRMLEDWMNTVSGEEAQEELLRKVIAAQNK